MRKKIQYILALLLLAGALLPGCGGEPATGWVERENGTFYKDSEGSCVSGWQEIDGSRYYFAQDGAMVTGWLELDGGRYYLTENGTLQTGWATVEGRERYFGVDGKMAVGWLEKDGHRCYAGEDGSLASGWLDDRGLVYYLDEKGVPLIGWQDLDGLRYYFQENGCLLTGWAEFSGERYHFAPNGPMQTGWAELDGKRYFFGQSGAMQRGWVQDGVYRYYLHEDGTAASGPTQIDGVTYYFNDKGIHVELVNPWHTLPQDYSVELSYIDTTQQIATLCYDDLMQMLSDCADAGHKILVVSGYRTMADQEFLYYRKVNKLVDMGYSWAAACREGAKEVAVPGTSEHQLGLAVDIVDSSYPYLDDYQANTAAQRWLMENCHKYGFILRYPTGTTDITGIIFEPWHYRYVGTEISWEIYRSGVTLEEYLGAVEKEG